MAHRCSRIVVIALALILSQLCVVYVFLNILNFRSVVSVKNSRTPASHHCDCRDKIQEIRDLQQKLERLQARVNVKKEIKKATNSTNKDEKTNEDYAKQGTVSLPRPENHDLANNIDLFAKFVTVILYKETTDTIPSSCLKARQGALLQLFPNIVILSLNSSVSTVGLTFNSLIQKVRTKYFLFLDCTHELFNQTSDHSSGWLLHALENIPELDFVSGSILTGDHLEIPCYRMILCNWTLSQRYEYQRSIDELMICENIAPSFMGRTASIERLFANKAHAFDDKMTTLSTTDFFIRAKKAGALSGVRPEAIYKASQDSNSNTAINKRDYFLRHLPFAHKHKVFRFKDSESETLDLCGRDSPILGEDICDESIAHKTMLDGGHWAHLGTFAYPFIINNLQYCLFIVADFLESKGIPYSIDGGVAIGAVKMRGILPWDSGDIDMLVFYKDRNAFYEILAQFAREKNYTSLNSHVEAIQFFCFPPNIAWKAGGIVTIFVHTEKIGSVMKIQTNGRWIPYMQFFYRLRKHYKLSYLQNKGLSHKPMHCKKEKHNACLPDFRELGKYGKTAGTFREFFCET